MLKTVLISLATLSIGLFVGFYLGKQPIETTQDEKSMEKVLERLAMLQTENLELRASLTSFTSNSNQTLTKQNPSENRKSRDVAESTVQINDSSVREREEIEDDALRNMVDAQASSLANIALARLQGTEGRNVSEYKKSRSRQLEDAYLNEPVNAAWAYEKETQIEALFFEEEALEQYQLYGAECRSSSCKVSIKSISGLPQDQDSLEKISDSFASLASNDSQSQEGFSVQSIKNPQTGEFDIYFTGNYISNE